METTQNINLQPAAAVQVMANHRQIAQKYGQFFGKQIYTIVSTNPDLKWKEDTQKGINTFRHETQALIIKAIDVVSVSILAKDLDTRPKVIINDNIEGMEPIVFELAEPDFQKATRENVRECIERLKKPGSSPMFFGSEDMPNLVKLVELANQSAITFYEDQARKCMQLADTVRQMSTANERLYTDYLRQCGVNVSDVEIHIQATANVESQS